MSSEDFKSLIITDPDLVDEGIDVSGLRTTTDTRLPRGIQDTRIQDMNMKTTT